MFLGGFNSLMLSKALLPFYIFLIVSFKIKVGTLSFVLVLNWLITYHLFFSVESQLDILFLISENNVI